MSASTPTPAPVTGGANAAAAASIAALVNVLNFSNANITSVVGAVHFIITEAAAIQAQLAASAQSNATVVSIATALIAKLLADGAISQTLASELGASVADAAHFLDLFNALASSVGVGAQVEAVETKAAAGCLGCLATGKC